jgi:hypothetical protein
MENQRWASPLWHFVDFAFVPDENVETGRTFHQCFFRLSSEKKTGLCRVCRTFPFVVCKELRFLFEWPDGESS